MPTTRRQLRVKKQDEALLAKLNPGELFSLSDLSDFEDLPDDHDMDIEAEALDAEEKFIVLSSSEERSDDDDDYSPRKKTPTSPRDAKRQKLDKGRKGKGKKGRKSLSVLPTMPLDILFEIFEYLHPTDLLRLTQTNKAFNGLLTSPKSTTIWKRSQKNTEADTPDCPSDMNEMQWANLLYGCECQVCGVKPLLKVEFGLRRRICAKCKKKHFVCARYFTKVYPDYPPEVMDLLLFTHEGAWSRRWNSPSKFFWDSDVETIALKYIGLQKGVHMKKPNAKANLEAFVAKRKELVEGIAETVDPCRRWARKVRYTRRNDRWKAKSEMIEEFKRRLDDMDEWTDQDKNRAIQSLHFDPSKALTVKYWERIWRKLKVLLDQEKNRRIERDRRNLVWSRLAIARELYNTHIQPMKAYDRLLLPSPEWIRKIPAFEEVIDAPDDVDVTEESFAVAMAELPAYLEEYKTTTNPAFKILREAIEPHITPEDPDELKPEGWLEPMRRATSVFCRSSYGVFEEFYVSVGFEATSTQWYLSTVQLHPRLCEVVKRIVQALGMDERTTHPFDLDGRDARFVCLRCEAVDKDGVYGRDAHSWRQMLKHYTAFDEDHAEPSVELLTNEEEADVKQREEPDARNLRRNWHCMSCNHPAVHLEHILCHIKEYDHDHKNDNPVEGRDYFWDFHYHWPPRAQVFHGTKVDPKSNRIAPPS